MKEKHNASRYLNGYCRCRICLAASKAQRRERIARNPALHGTVTGYNYGCREDCCRKVSMAYQRGRRAIARARKKEAWIGNLMEARARGGDL